MVLTLSYGQVGFQVRRIHLQGDSFVLGFLYSLNNFRYHIIAVTQGQLELSCGCDGLKAGPLDICLLPPDTYMKASGGAPALVWLFRFTETYLQQALYATYRDTLLPLLYGSQLHSLAADRFHFKMICQLLQLLEKHGQPGSYINSNEITTLAFNLLLNCLGELRPQIGTVLAGAVKRKEQLTIRFMRLAEQRAGEHHDVGYYACELCLTRGHLTKTVKQLTGKTPKAIIAGVLVRMATELLDGREAPVYAIAELLHFGSSSAFVNFFRNHTGSTPEAYRNRKK